MSLQKDSAATHRVVTLKDVEEGAVTLRKVGESLAGLKGKTTNNIFTLEQRKIKARLSKD